MTFVNVAELKNQTSKVLRRVQAGRVIAVTNHGKPCAAILPISGKDLDQLLFEDSPLVIRAVKEAIADIEKGRWTSLKSYAKRRFLNK